MALFDYYSASIGAWIQADTITGQYQAYTDATLTEFDANGPQDFTPEELVLATLIAPAPPPAVANLDQLNAALITLRGVTADHLITPEEAAALEQIVIPALESFRDLGVADPDAIYTASLVLAQIIQAVYAVVKQQSVVIQQIASGMAALNGRVTTAESAIAALQQP